MKRSIGIIQVAAVVLLLGCGSDAIRGKDGKSEMDAGDPCLHMVFGANCPSACPAPCVCRELTFDSVTTDPFPTVCAPACVTAQDCASGQRCGYVWSAPGATGSAVCLPDSLEVPPGDYVGGSVDCMFDPRLGTRGCRGQAVVLYDKVMLTGSWMTGCALFEVVEEVCGGACAGGQCGTAWDAGQ